MKLDGLRVQLPGRAPEASRKRAWRRWALPAAFGGAAISWYAADSLRHRREAVAIGSGRVDGGKPPNHLSTSARAASPSTPPAITRVALAGTYQVR